MTWADTRGAQARYAAQRKIQPDVLRELHAKGMTDSDMARHFGVLRNNLCKARMKLGLPSNAKFRPLTSEQNTARWALYRLRLSDIEIARKQGVDCSAILQWRVRRKLPPNVGKGEHIRPVYYPPVRRHPLTPDELLMQHARSVVGRYLSPDIADDAVGDLLLAIVEGRIKPDVVRADGRRFSKHVLRTFADRWKVRSLDEEIGDDHFTLMDTVRDQRSSLWLEEAGATMW